jgi:phenylpropionate dioxygenase-like ring-hydroxylating dioxygenase large terminal subunit
MTTHDDHTMITESTADGAARLYESFRHYWHPVAYVSHLGDGPMKVRLLGEELVIVRLAGQPCAFYDLCVHRGTPLSLGFVDQDRLRCAYHGWAYDCSGACTEIPSVTGGRIPARARLRRYQVAERSGLLWVCLDEHPGFDLPEFVQFNDPEFRVLEVPAYDWACSAPRRFENVVDFAHFAWLHEGLLGSRAHPEVPAHEVRREGGELRVEIGFEEPTDTQKNANLGLADTRVTAEKRYRLFMPFSALNEQCFPDGKKYVLFWAFSPLGPKLTRTFTLIARNYGLTPEGDRDVLQFNAEVIAADKPVVEGQRPEELPFDLTAELHIRQADRVSIEYRKWLYELAAAPA